MSKYDEFLKSIIALGVRYGQENPLTKSMIPVESLFEKYLTMKIKDDTK